MLHYETPNNLDVTFCNSIEEKTLQNVTFKDAAINLAIVSIKIHFLIFLFRPTFFPNFIFSLFI